METGLVSLTTLLAECSLDAFYAYLETLPDGEALRADLELVDRAVEALEWGEGSLQASMVAYRLAEVAEGVPSCAEALVTMFNQLGEALMLY